MITRTEGLIKSSGSQGIVGIVVGDKQTNKNKQQKKRKKRGQQKVNESQMSSSLLSSPLLSFKLIILSYQCKKFLLLPHSSKWG